MSRLEIRRHHALPPAEAQRRVARVAERLSERFGATCSWDRNVLCIRHPALHGTVTVGSDEIVVDAAFGLALRPLRGHAEREIVRVLDREFGA